GRILAGAGRGGRASLRESRRVPVARRVLGPPVEPGVPRRGTRVRLQADRPPVGRHRGDARHVLLLGPPPRASAQRPRGRGVRPADRLLPPPRPARAGGEALVDPGPRLDALLGPGARADALPPLVREGDHPAAGVRKSGGPAY